MPGIHWGSFFAGWVTGVATASLGKRLRPALVELASSAYQVSDSIAARLAMRREDAEDLLAEARARARGVRRPAAQRRTAAKTRMKGTRRTRTARAALH